MLPAERCDLVGVKLEKVHELNHIKSAWMTTLTEVDSKQESSVKILGLNWNVETE